MKILILSIIMATTSISIMGQGHTTDEQAINKQIDAFFNSWNKHNFDDMEKYTADDCDWVNVVGMWWKGRKQVQFAHQVFHDGMFKNTPLTNVSSNVRFVTDDVAIVHVISKVGAYYPPDGINRGGNKLGDENNLGLLIFVKKDNVWLLTSGENVPINDHAAKSNPVLRMH